MNKSELEKIINKAFDNKQNINEKSETEILKAINQTIEWLTTFEDTMTFKFY